MVFVEFLIAKFEKHRAVSLSKVMTPSPLNYHMILMFLWVGDFEISQRFVGMFLFYNLTLVVSSIFRKSNTILYLLFFNPRSSRSALFCKKCVYGNFKKFIGKHVGVFFKKKLKAWGLQLRPPFHLSIIQNFRVMAEINQVFFLKLFRNFYSFLQVEIYFSTT